MPFKAVLFDLDGTLLDTLDDIADSMNAALAELGFPTHPVVEYRLMVGDGTKMLVKRVLPTEKLDDETAAKCLSLMAEEYSRRWKSKTKPYNGILEMLNELKNRNLDVSVLSNKDDHFTKAVVGHFFADYPFKVVRGVSEQVLPKPNPSGALQIADELNIAAADFLYVGDTNTDMKTAVAAGMYPLGVNWGFRTAEELRENGAKQTIDHPAQIIEVIDGQS